MKEQCEIMWQYSEILGKRIAKRSDIHDATCSDWLWITPKVSGAALLRPSEVKRTA